MNLTLFGRVVGHPDTRTGGTASPTISEEMKTACTCSTMESKEEDGMTMSAGILKHSFARDTEQLLTAYAFILHSLK